MIPLKVELKNFLSYGDEVQTVDFKDYPLICFSGKNGHGKSALLDAITWGIWGHARKISGATKADVGLLRLGQTQMMVSVEFEFNKNRYRVRREFFKTYGRNVSNLDFEVFNKDKEEFVALTDKTSRATQEKIDKLLGLDFETFTNSAFLRQGQANEFSQKTPRERKQILTNILGLSLYDDLKQKALENTKKHNDEKMAINNLLVQAHLEMAKEKDLSENLKLYKKELKYINSKIDELQKDLATKEKQQFEHLAQEQKYDLLVKEQKNLNDRYQRELEKFKNLVALWRDINRKSLGSIDINNQEKEKSVLLEQERAFRETQKKELSLQEETLKLQAEYQKKEEVLKKNVEEELYEAKLELDRHGLEFKNVTFVLNQKASSKKELEKKLVLLNCELKEIEVKLKKQDKFEKNYSFISKQFEKRRACYQVFIQRGNWTKTALSDIESKTDVMHDEKDPSCPLCEQLLTARRKQFLAQKFSKEKGFCQRRLAKISLLIKKLKAILLLQNEEMQKLKEKDAEFKKAISKKDEISKSELGFKKEIAVLDRDIADLGKQKEKLQKLITKLSLDKTKFDKNCNDKIKKDKTLLNLDVALKTLSADKGSLKYNKKEHQKLSEKLDKVERYLKEFESLKKDLMHQSGRKEKISEFASWLKEQKKSITNLKEETKKIVPDVLGQKKLEQKINEVKKSVSLLAKEKDKNLQDIGSKESELKRIKELKEKNKQSEKKLKEIEKEIAEFQTLASIFGKDGIQALLIEEAIPQIEMEANSILSRLTDNQAQIFIESLRDLKKGGVKETLDIKISDAVGIRPYEMFSGGEAFRIDFALRIAISKLLAQRAGTALQTLMIDEGFGSQDEEGLARLMDAIYAIQKDFSKIIVVSHLPIFKDNFPIHFVVEKTSNGSMVSVEERG